MEETPPKLGLLNLFALFFAAVAGWLTSRYANCPPGWVGSLFFLFSFLVSLAAWFHMHLLARENRERRDLEQLSQDPHRLFAEQAADHFPARRVREQFERFVVPSFSLLIFIGEIAAAVWQWKETQQRVGPEMDEGHVAMTVFAMLGMLLFALGKYGLGVVRLEGNPLLRPSATSMVWCGLVGFLVAVSGVFAWFGFSMAALWSARFLCVMLGLAGLEGLFFSLMEVYRPRKREAAGRLLYESNLLEFFVEPKSWAGQAARLLEYQFGMKITEAAFREFLVGTVLKLSLLTLAVLFFSSAMVVIDPHEEGLLERFGALIPGRPPLGPGLHFKFPWPIDRVQRYSTQSIQEFEVGAVESEKLEEEDTVLWSHEHKVEEFNYLVASREISAGDGTQPRAIEQTVPVNLLTVSIPVQYVIADVRAWAEGYRHPAAVLEKAANQAVTRYCVSVGLDEIMAARRLEIAADLKQRIQAKADELKLGVKILFVGMQDNHPPVKVVDAFEAVIGSMQEKESEILDARAYAAEAVPMAQAQADKELSEANGYHASQVAAAEAKAAQFGDQLAAYQASPVVFRRRTYLEKLTQGLTSARKVILSVTNSSDVIQLDLEEKIRPDLLDIPVPSSKK